MTTKFKIGDKVKCINNISVESLLMLNQVYTVDGIDENSFISIEGRHFYFNEKRFVNHIKEERKKKLIRIYGE